MHRSTSRATSNSSSRHLTISRLKYFNNIRRRVCPAGTYRIYWHLTLRIIHFQTRYESSNKTAIAIERESGIIRRVFDALARSRNSI